MNRLRYVSTGILFFFLTSFLLPAQNSVTGSITGLVTDQTGAAVSAAQVRVLRKDTGTVFNATANSQGEYVVPGVPVGVYQLEASAAGFRREVVNDAKVDVGAPSTINFKLELGATTESISVEADAAQVVTATATVGTTITGRQITELPFTSRDALDLALLTPGSSAGGAPRQSSLDGLPHDAINITMDGINTQDDLLKSSSGGAFYTYIRPRVDAVEEFSVSTAANDAASSGEGAVQIKFVTKRGTNDFHGGGYWYVRNTALNSNYYFNNETGQPRQLLKLNQVGGKLGGPIWKNKAFFFFNVEDYILPESNFRSRTVLTTAAINGNFVYKTGSGTNSVNLLQLAGMNGYNSTLNPEIHDVLTKIDANRPSTGIIPLNQFEDTMSFNTTDKQNRKFVTTRFDYNITQKLQWEFIYNYDYFYSNPDSLNSLDAPYPNLATYGGYMATAGQISNRFSGATALHWTVTPHMINELRAGLQGGTGQFDTAINPGALPNGLRISFPSSLNLTSPISRQPSQNRNTPVKQISDNLSWVKGDHNLNFGVNVSLIAYWGSTISGLYPNVNFAVTGTDPVASIFTTTNFPGAASTDLANAQNLYALLTGRVSTASSSVYVNPATKQYQPLQALIEHDHQHEFGLFVQDNWRVRPNLTVNYGLRWEYQGSPYDSNGIYTTPTYAGIWGTSGVGNLFQPGASSGTATQYISSNKPDWFNPSLKNFAPNVGLAYSPKSDNAIVKFLFGKTGAFRAGYGISYIRDGMNVFTGTEGANPGPSATSSLTADTDFPAGTVLLANGLPKPTVFPSSYSSSFPASLFTYRSVSGYAADPNLRTPYVQSWSAGIQRELSKNTVLEVRYVANHAIKLLRNYNLNEVNTLNNGFIGEFNNALNNYNICSANRTACTGTATGAIRFDNRGLPGQVNTPILNAAFAGLSAASGFANGTFITDLTQGQAGALANSLAGSATFLPNLVKGGYPANFFQVNPALAGAGAYLLANGGMSNYNSLQIELRRRFTHNLMVNANYVYSNAITDFYGDSATESQNYVTLRNGALNRTVSPYNIKSQFKVNFIYELPFGPGHALTTHSGLTNRIIGGWQVQGIGRIQSGAPFILNSGRLTLNQYDAGVVANVSRSELQSHVGVYKQPNGQVFWIDPSFIGSDGRANPQYLAPAQTAGQVGDPYFYLYGPRFVRWDLTASKKTRITEHVNAEIRAEFLNAFNNVNFIVGSAGASTSSNSITSTSFGRLTNAYQDISTTNDPGGRIIQLVLRINF